MKKKASKGLVLSKETLRTLADVPGDSLREVAGGSTGSYCCSCGSGESQSCCF
jgi:hypothetical protein